MQQLLIYFDLSPEAHQFFTQIDEKIEEIGSNSGHIHVRYYLQFFSGQLPKIADSPLGHLATLIAVLSDTATVLAILMPTDTAI